MSVLLIAFAILFGPCLAVLVGILGSRHKSGFGWTFLISVLFTPLVGIICALVSEPLPEGERKWGCLGVLFAISVLIVMVVLFVLCLSYV